MTGKDGKAPKGALTTILINTVAYVRNLDKSIRFKVALNLTTDEKSVSTGRFF